jgi:hypothetical protein
MLAGGLVQLAAPIYAAGTTAGADISNTATASYEDPNEPGITSNTISNTVSVKVEKVAGIVVTGEGATDVTSPGLYNPNDIVHFDFKITNTGNSAVKFSIPGAATVLAGSSTPVAGDVQSVQYYNPADPTAPTTGPDAGWVTITNGGASIPANMPAIAVDGFMKARVVVKVRGTASPGDDLIVELGKTAQLPTTTSPVSNKDRTVSPENSDTADVFTIDITNDPIAPGSIPQGNAVNHTREAAALQMVNVSAVKQAFVNIDMTGSAPVADPAAPTDVTKNKITYDITVKVDPNSPDPNKNPSDLGATPVKIGANTENHVLISDPVPTGTTPTALVAPTGWTPVFSTSPAGTAPELVVWTKVTPTTPLPTTGVTFVGFIKDDSAVLPMNATPYAGFQIVVQTTGASTTVATTISNVADIYGTTPTAAGLADPTKPIQDKTGTTAPDTITGATPVTTTITPPTAAGLSIFNGPKDKPGAVGSDGSKNSDFTNKSAEIQIGSATVTDPVTGALTPLTTTSLVSFSNTVKNEGTTPTDIYLLPTTTGATLPTGTVVQITYGSETRTYTYTAAAGATPASYSTTDTAKLPIVLLNVAPGATLGTSYGVSVTLPIGTPQLAGYNAPITAFAGGATPVAGQTTVATGTTVSSNTTIDTVYTGFIDLKKEARILTTAGDASLSDTAKPYSSGTLTVKPLPGQFIQYRINYKNITNSNGGSGVDNSLLNAGKLKIVEDGNAAGSTWGGVTTHSVNSAADSVGGKVIFNDGTLTNGDVTVTKYVVDMGQATPAVTIAPQQTGKFTFLRQVK